MEHVIRILGMIVIVISSFALVGNFAHVPYLYNWGLPSSGMSFPTSTCFWLLSIAVVLRSFQMKVSH